MKIESDGGKTDLLRGTLEMIVLKTLERNGAPMHGYGIAQEIKWSSKNVLRAEEGSLYPALQRLCIKGLVKSEWSGKATGRRARYYRLTAVGRKQIAKDTVAFRRLLQATLRLVHAG